MSDDPSTEPQRWVAEARRLLDLKKARQRAPVAALDDFSQGFDMFPLPKWGKGQQPRPLAEVKGGALANREADSLALKAIGPQAKAYDDAVRSYIRFHNDSQEVVVAIESVVGKRQPRDVPRLPAPLTLTLPDGSELRLEENELVQYATDQATIQAMLFKDLDERVKAAFLKERGIERPRDAVPSYIRELEQRRPGISAEGKAEHMVGERLEELHAKLLDQRIEERALDAHPDELRAALQRRKATEAKLASVEAQRRTLRDRMTERRAATTGALGAIGGCLPVLDAPENNPERPGVLKLRQELAGMSGAAPAASRHQAIRKLERELHQWVDRRSREHLPPPAEALRMLDDLREVEDALMEEIIQKKDDLPLPALAEAEHQAVQALWREMRDGQGDIRLAPQDEDKPYQTGPHTGLWKRGIELPTPSPKEQQAQKSKLLGTMARLLQVEAGRSLLIELKATRKPLSVLMGPRTSSADLGRDGGLVVVIEAKALEGDMPGVSSRMGDPLLSPGPVLLGHELIHALHNALGQRNAGELPAQEPEWENAEELETILNGALSEQALRDQYGLGAERFGHINVGPSETGLAIERRLAGLAEYEAQGGSVVDGALRERGFDPDAMEIAQRIELKGLLDFDDKIRGPLREGWRPIQLSVVQMLGILRHDLGFRLDELGWSPSGLPVDGGVRHPVLGGAQSLVEITRFGMPQLRSPDGRRFAALGGRPVFDRLAEFPLAFRAGLGAWDAAAWRSNLVNLEGWRDRLVQLEGVPAKIVEAMKGKLGYLDMLRAVRKKAAVEHELARKGIQQVEARLKAYRDLCASLRGVTSLAALGSLLGPQGYQDDVINEALRTLKDDGQKSLAQDALFENALTLDEYPDAALPAAAAAALADALLECLAPIEKERAALLESEKAWARFEA